MPNDTPTPVPDPPERESDTDDTAPTVECPSCELSFPEDEQGDFIEVIVGRRPAYSRPHMRTELWCPQCASACAVEVEDDFETLLVSESYAGDAFYCWDDGSWHTTPEPESEDDETPNLLYSYGTDVLAVHGYNSSRLGTRLAFGVELEMESCTPGNFRPMVELLGGMDGAGSALRYILKSDGSLADGQGAELVTLPYTLEQHHMHDWGQILTSALRRIARSGQGTSNCGMHVHVNRAALSPLTVGKLMQFVHSENTRELLTLIAQRRPNGYCEAKEHLAHVAAVRSGDFSRYDALNVSGRRTIEFRLFRGNLRPERVLKNLEFCHALIRYCEQTSITDVDNDAAFLKFVGSNSKRYPHLSAFLAEMRQIPAPAARSTSRAAMLYKLAPSPADA